MRPAGSSGSPRGWIGAALGTIGVVALLLALVTAYAQRALFDSGANLIAVDFWRTGDVLGVADELNGVGGRPGTAARP